MSYKKISAHTSRAAEATLPLRKWGYFLLLLSAWPVAASETLRQQIEAQIKQDVARFSRQLGVTGPARSQIDLSLPGGLQGKGRCHQLQLSRRNADQPPWGRVSYSVNCQDPLRWQSRVQAKITVYLPVVVARQAIAKGETISAAMLTTRETAMQQNKLGFVTDAADVLGMQAKRRINAGQPVSRHLLAAQLLVEKGHEVIIQVQKAGFTASTKGVALADGRLGERIKVRNLSSGKELDAEVIASATVQTFF